jgi:hypothetical protein
VPITWTFDNGSGDRIRSDGQPYDGTLFSCVSNDATLNFTKRPVFLNFGTYIPSSGTPDSWMTGEVGVELQFNIHKLGTLRDAQTTMPEEWPTAFMTGQVNGPNHKTYRLRMTPFEVSTGPSEILPDGSVNDPYETSPVRVNFLPGCGAGCGNPYGTWQIDGYATTFDGSYTQVGTLYRVANTWVKVGQFSLPFRVTIKANAPLPELP